MKFTIASSLILVGAYSTLSTVSSFVLPISSNAAIKPTALQTQQRMPLTLQSSTTDIEVATTASETETATPVVIDGMPSHSPATSLENQIYNWRGYNIRYQVSGPEDADHTLLLIHGLFVNSDHWRKMLTGLHTHNDELNNDHESSSSTSVGGNKTYRVYALDLLGSGWSSKPLRDDPKAQLINGENGRFADCGSVCYREQEQNNKGKKRLQKRRSAPILENMPLGTASGGNRLATALELRHPLKSPYNFYTWAEQIADFTHDVIHNDDSSSGDSAKKVTLVANSIGTMSALQSILDEPNLFNGCFVINPNFRELHMAEVPFSQLTMPLVRQVQSLLREKGHGLFKTLATPETVTEILKEPYAVTEAIDEELVSVLLDPLLTEGADEVVFDTLSYSAGPLPEQQLSSAAFPKDCPVWVVYGKDDPWTPSKRVENLKNVCGRPGEGYGESPVERVVALEGVGHCPHDECPEKVNELVLEFLDRLD
mmetsp:Transcript_14455/g.31356  ORF Transcript_14455/g.31356 Transcript_14455/m.31356 type:complete len:484 (-) Transcript_14455:156-1607(-)|eukprot:CAMPEP_0172321694 /NCGR_PEP_ID=MMETSP1058-20130122/44043_1 /TAXON_ID=83371 /ORGANISM="Detonula confervacea, Strain CCMP 353" /LENGTH=483 /DNA_ID=CAMNT_0013037275 /DNA_START=70 /DNA_END=1521 /DNA_ORIENTATION=+